MCGLERAIHKKYRQNVNVTFLQLVNGIFTTKCLPLTRLFRHEGLLYHSDNIRNKEVLQISAILK